MPRRLSFARSALERCLALVQQQPPAVDEALAAALEAWRAAREPRLADVIDRLSAMRLAEITTAPRRGNKWSREAQTAALRTQTSLRACWLLVQAELGVGMERAEVGPLGDDPRLARALFRVLFEREMFQGFHARKEGHLERHADRLAALADVRFADPLRTALASPYAFPGQAAEERARPCYERTLAALERERAKLRPLDRRAEQALAAIVALLPGQDAVERTPAKVVTTSAAQILEAVFASPDDDVLRRVCGDRLLELGDPRGELIALQFAELEGERSAERQKRIKTLFNKHAGHWAGDLAPIGTREGMRYDKGFLAEVTLDKSPVGLKREMWDAALDSPFWATVAQVNVGDRVPDWWLRAFLASPRSSRVRRIAFRVRRSSHAAITLERPDGAPPGAAYRVAHLHQAVRKLARALLKFQKAIGALSREQIELLAEDARALGAPADLVTAITRAASARA